MLLTVVRCCIGMATNPPFESLSAEPWSHAQVPAGEVSRGTSGDWPGRCEEGSTNRKDRKSRTNKVVEHWPRVGRPSLDWLPVDKALDAIDPGPVSSGPDDDICRYEKRPASIVCSRASSFFVAGIINTARPGGSFAPVLLDFQPQSSHLHSHSTVVTNKPCG